MREKKGGAINIKTSVERKAAVEDLADRLKITITDVVETAIDRYLKAKNKP